MKVAIYARVSTLNHGQLPEMQVRELREFAAARGWAIAGEFVDTGVSGAKDSRPELNRLMSEAHRRKFDAAAVWKFDRFCRSVWIDSRKSNLQPCGSCCGQKHRFVVGNDQSVFVVCGGCSVSGPNGPAVV